MSSSVIRILPRKKIERHVIPYGTVLGKVLSRRMGQAAFVVLLAIILTSPIISLLLWTRSITGLIITLALCTVPVLLKSKVLLTAEPLPYSSAAVEFINTLCSSKFVVTLLSYLLSAYLYFTRVVSSRLSLHTLEKADFSEHPEGIPASLALHQTDKWYLIHENYLFLYGFTYVLAVVFSLSQMKRCALDTDERENGMKPIQRLSHRSRKFKTTIFLWALCSLGWPLMYLLFGRRFLFGLLTVGLRETKTRILSGFSIKFMVSPLKVLPLVLLWTLCQEAFMAYLTLGPVYKGKPISDLAGSDKNGTLVDGMSKSPGSISARFAWNELLFIAEHIKSRRDGIFADVDSERVIWDTIANEFVKLMEQHVSHLKKPGEGKAVQKQPKAKIHNDQAKGADDTSSTAQILGTTKDAHKIMDRDHLVDHKKLQVHMTNPDLFRPKSALEKRLANFTSKLETQSQSRVDAARKKVKHYFTLVHQKRKEWLELFLETNIGRPFLRTMDRKLAILITNRKTTSFALRGIARMITKSLNEDQNGYVQGTIGRILVLLDDYAIALEHLIKAPPIDSLDVAVKKHKVSPNLEVAENMLAEVNGAFVEIAQVFEPYYENLGVNASVHERTKRGNAGVLKLA